MSLSKETQALLAAARAETPAETMQDAMWSKLEVGLGLIPAPAASGIRDVEAPNGPPSAPPGPPPAPPAPPLLPPAPPAPAAVVIKTSVVLKAGFIGGGVGSAFTVAAVFVGMRLMSGAPEIADTPPPESIRHERSLEERAPSMLAPLSAPRAESSPERVAPTRTVIEAPVVDPLSREVSLVMDSRQALIGGDPARALETARKAKELRGQLGQEAMTLEVRALRALGRDTEADFVEIKLRAATGR